MRRGSYSKESLYSKKATKKREKATEVQFVFVWFLEPELLIALNDTILKDTNVRGLFQFPSCPGFVVTQASTFLLAHRTMLGLLLLLNLLDYKSSFTHRMHWYQVCRGCAKPDAFPKSKPDHIKTPKKNFF